MYLCVYVYVRMIQVIRLHRVDWIGCVGYLHIYEPMCTLMENWWCPVPIIPYYLYLWYWRLLIPAFLLYIIKRIVYIYVCVFCSIFYCMKSYIYCCYYLSLTNFILLNYSIVCMYPPPFYVTNTKCLWFQTPVIWMVHILIELHSISCRSCFVP